jgi:DNA-binding transcriptional LysR family regulator
VNPCQLRAVLAVAENKAFGAAAGALHTVQSNVSTHIAHLEVELGAPLVERRTGILTAEGHVVAARVLCIEAEIEAIHCDLASLHRQCTGTARVGMLSTTARWMAPLFFAGAHRPSPVSALGHR